MCAHSASKLVLVVVRVRANYAIKQHVDRADNNNSTFGFWLCSRQDRRPAWRRLFSAAQNMQTSGPNRRSLALTVAGRPDGVASPSGGHSATVRIQFVSSFAFTDINTNNELKEEKQNEKEKNNNKSQKYNQTNVCVVLASLHCRRAN